MALHMRLHRRGIFHPKYLHHCCHYVRFIGYLTHQTQVIGAAQCKSSPGTCIPVLTLFTQACDGVQTCKHVSLQANMQISAYARVFVVHVNCSVHWQLASACSTPCAFI